MARLKDVVDECLLIAEAFSSIKSQTYNEIGAVNFEDNDKSYPLLLFNKSNVSVVVDKYSRINLPSQSTYTVELKLLNTYTELEKVTIDLQTKQDALMVIADQYFAELRTRCESGSKGFYLGSVSFTSLDESHNEQLIELTYTVEFISKLESCTLGTFNY